VGLHYSVFWPVSGNKTPGFIGEFEEPPPKNSQNPLPVSKVGLACVFAEHDMSIVSV